MTKRDGKWGVSDLRQLVESRAGPRVDGCRIWHWEGEIIALGTGRTLAGIEGVEIVRLLSRIKQRQKLQNTHRKRIQVIDGSRQVPSGVLVGSIGTMDEHDDLEWSAKAVGRKIFFYKDLKDGTFMKDWRFRPTSMKRTVYPIEYPYQVLTFGLKGGKAAIWSETNVGMKVRATVMRLLEAPRMVGRAMTLSFAYLSNHQGREMDVVGDRRRVRVGAGKMNSGSSGLIRRSRCVEKFDLILDREHPTTFWVRHGRCPSWYGGGYCVTYMRGTTKKSWNDLPNHLAQYVRSTRPLFDKAPKNIQEIQRYQSSHREMLLEASRRRTRLFGLL